MKDQERSARNTDTSAGGSLPSFQISLQSIQKQINRLNLSANVKLIILKIASFSVHIGNAVLSVGRYTVDIGIKLARAFPNTTFGAVMAIVVTTLLAMVPLIGPFLAGVVGPIVGAIAILAGALNDMRLRALINRGKFADAGDYLRGKVEADESPAGRSTRLDAIAQMEQRLEALQRAVENLGGAKEEKDVS